MIDETPRYAVILNGSAYAGHVPSPDGPWVRVTDHEDAVAALRRALAEKDALISSYEKAIDETDDVLDEVCRERDEAQHARDELKARLDAIHDVNEEL